MLKSNKFDKKGHQLPDFIFFYEVLGQEIEFYDWI